MEQQQISAKKQKAMEKVKRANAELAKVVREEKEQLRKAQDRHKYMMGGCVVKYFPEAYDFSEQEMNRIIACAFSLKDVKNMINTVLKERPDPTVSMRSIAGKKRKSGSEARHTSKSVIAGNRRNMRIPRHLQGREIRRLLNCWQSMTAG